MSSETPRIESFVLRFVSEAPNAAAAQGTPAWHGVVVHVQTNEEKTFTHFADAVAFIARHVPIGDFGLQVKDDLSPE